MAVSRSSFHSRKPTPTGKVGCAGGRSNWVFEMIDDASFRSWPVSLVVTPGPMNPRPPVLDTATASDGPATTAIGALTRNGLVTHGKADRTRAVIVIGV